MSVPYKYCEMSCAWLIRYSLKLTQADMRQEVEEYLPSLSEWAKHYLHTSPQAGQKQLTLKL